MTKRLFATTIILIFTIFSVNSQNISKVSEIYDFDIGDIFHIQTNASGPGFGFWSIRNIEILDYYYSENSTTINYIRDIDYKETSSWNPEWSYEYYIDTLSIVNLDSLINFGDIDSVFSDPNFYNERLINMKEYDEYCEYEKNYYVLGCGLAYIYSIDYEYESDYTIEIVYYNKSGEEWGSPQIVSIGNMILQNSLSFSPNPTSNSINITTNKELPIILRIYTMNGSLIKEFLIEKNNSEINISDLDTGVYILYFKNSEFCKKEKLIKM